MVDGMVYAVGGWEGSQRLKTVEQYNPDTNTWKFVAPLKLAVTSPAVVAHGGTMYVTGGAILEDGDGIELVQRYDPRRDAWTEVSPMLIPRSGSAACVLNNFIYVLGKFSGSSIVFLQKWIV
jgi:N-acetylneuraminic acid mutarotase